MYILDSLNVFAFIYQPVLWSRHLEVLSYMLHEKVGLALYKYFNFLNIYDVIFVFLILQINIIKLN